MIYGVLFGVSLLTAVLLVPLAQWLSHALGIVAIPGGRRLHKGRMPKLGGIPLMGALVVGGGLAFWLLPPGPEDAKLLTGVMLGTFVVFVGGLLDDWLDLSAKMQFLIQIMGSFVAVWFEVFIERFTNPLTGQQVVIPWTAVIFGITLFWVMGMINTINFLDGLDGLAAGVGTIAALVFAWHTYRLGQTTAAAFPLVLAGALIGLLFFNFAPARIYLGSAGAYLLGYQLATLAIISPAKIATALLVLAVPIIDVAWRIVDRVSHGHSPFYGDRGHLHHLLVDRGLPTQRIVLGYYGVALAFGLIAVLAQSPLLKLGLLVLLATAVLGLLLWLGRRKNPE